MCGRFTNTGSKSDEIQRTLATKLGVAQLEHDRGYERFNVAPTQEVLAVVSEQEERAMRLLRWGLVPHWAKDVKVGSRMINARSESLHERPAYRGLASQAEHRCLILADGYYEWQKPEDRRQPRRPVHFALESDEPFCFAGLWTRWSDCDGDTVASCTIVTCEANDVTRPIHDRMPVVLTDVAAWDAWLDSSVDPRAARELLVPLDADEMVVRRANPIANSGRHEGPDCLVSSPPRASNEMPVMTDAARTKPVKDAGRPHTQAVCGRPRTQPGADPPPPGVRGGVLKRVLSLDPPINGT